MEPISKTFFITGIGRSGTRFLSKLLNRSEQYRVVHEWRIRGTPFRDGRMQRFPLYRFLLARHPFGTRRPGYGEVNSHLRRTLSLGEAGLERLIERRAVIFRDPRDIVRSGMNRRDRTPEDFERICNLVFEENARLRALIDHPTLAYDRFEFEPMTSDLDYLQSVIEWTGISDLRAEESDIRRKVNVSPTSWFPPWSEWGDDKWDVFHAAERRWADGALGGPSSR